MNICLLSADKLSDLCRSPGQYEPLPVSHLKKKASSVVDLQDVLENEEDGRIQTSGIAGSGKSTAFMVKAPHEWALCISISLLRSYTFFSRSPLVSKTLFEWAKVNPPLGRRPFWQHIALFFRGSLTNTKWWKAQGLVEIFGFAQDNLTKE